MSKKIFLIAIFIISLLLIGLMMLVADANNKVLGGFSSMEQKFSEANESLKTNVDSLQKQLETSTEIIPEIVTQFNTKADELLAHIQLLKQELISNDATDYNYKDPGVEKNNALFFTADGKHSEKGTQFLAKIETYENTVAIIHLEFPKTNSQKFKLRKNVRKNQDWLNHNFKGFPLIASYTNLTAMESDVKNKQKLILTTILNN